MTCECGCTCCGTPDLPAFEGPAEPGGFSAYMDRKIVQAVEAQRHQLDRLILHGATD